ncbi:MAG TPA: ferritin family protein [Anaerolineales bacterium]|jgi:rubrerythrin
MDITRILEYALEREYEGKRFFIENAARLQNAAAQGAFKAIAAEEQKHIDFIAAQIAAQNAGVSAELPELPKAGFFAERAENENVEQSVSEAMVADLPVLRMAYLIERDFAEFYAMAASQTEGEPQKMLQMLAHWEAGHERLFKHLHDKAFELYSGMPWGG